MRTGRHAVVLAAGAGRRFGGGKLLADWRGEPLVLAAVRSALAARVDEVVLVVGADAAAVTAAADTAGDPRLRIVPASDWAQGLGASLAAGVRSLPPDAEKMVVFLGDMPAIPEGLADQLLDALDGPHVAARTVSPHGPAHPVAFARDVFDALGELTEDQGAKSLLAALGPRVASVFTDDPGVVFDVDRPEDLARLP
ncbi:NTP transferase domain-containing protein [Brevundimonas sp. PAMC22021]|uniref:nucleotidyltransferase family protein n=1 Tax=Brevundimonas sp. PAMC22021 TaxID=2861285 RepID=UPI001C63512B|nr:NTP transferase domain-containing protein [Brevundimonas sp. PAMC22021]QYF87384.1 NTP transferase domain-containing protein [Brevundimonas sp. PAMC22021]